MLSAKRSATYIPLALGANSCFAQSLRATLAPTGRQPTRLRCKARSTRFRLTAAARRGRDRRLLAPRSRQIRATSGDVWERQGHGAKSDVAEMGARALTASPPVNGQDDARARRAGRV